MFVIRCPQPLPTHYYSLSISTTGGWGRSTSAGNVHRTLKMVKNVRETLVQIFLYSVVFFIFVNNEERKQIFYFRIKRQPVDHPFSQTLNQPLYQNEDPRIQNRSPVLPHQLPDLSGQAQTWMIVTNKTNLFDLIFDLPCASLILQSYF